MALDSLALGLDEGTVTESDGTIAGQIPAFTAHLNVFEAPAAAIGAKIPAFTAQLAATLPSAQITALIPAFTGTVAASVTGAVTSPGTSAQLGQLFLGSAELGVDLAQAVVVGGGETAAVAGQIGAFTAQMTATTGNEDCDIDGTMGAFTASMAASTLACIASISAQIPAFTGQLAASASNAHSAAGINVTIPNFGAQLQVKTTSFAAGGYDSKVKRRKVKIEGQWVDLTDEEWADYLNREQEPEVVAEAPKKPKKKRIAPADKSGLLAPLVLPKDAPLPFRAPQIDHSQALRFAQQLQHASSVKNDDEDVMALLAGMD